MIEDAIGREKQLKGGPRLAKTQLIENFNPEWKDLFFNIENLSFKNRLLRASQ